MATSEYIVVSSDSSHSTGTAASFTQILGNNYILTGGTNYEIKVVSASFPTPHPYTNLPIYITCDLVNTSSLYGEVDSYITLIDQEMPTKIQSQYVYYNNMDDNAVSLKRRVFNSLSIKIRDASGVDIPNTGKSNVVLAFRPVV